MLRCMLRLTATSFSSTVRTPPNPVLDINRPENSPYGMLLLRNPSCWVNNMVVDTLVLYLFLMDIRDARAYSMVIRNNGKGLRIKCLRLPRYAQDHIDDIHDGLGSVVKEAHLDTVRRITASNNKYRFIDLDMPEGVTVRTAPFTTHMTTVHKIFQENDMDFGEVDAADVPILHHKEWVKFTFAINKEEDSEFNGNVVVDGTDVLNNRFIKTYRRMSQCQLNSSQWVSDPSPRP